MLWKHQPFEPIEQVVRQHVAHQMAHIYDHGMAAQAGKFKTVLVFLDKVLHTAAVAVEPDDIFQRKIHVCYDECIHVSHLISGLFYFTDDPLSILPRAGHIHEGKVTDSVVNLGLFYFSTILSILFYS